MCPVDAIHKAIKRLTMVSDRMLSMKKLYWSLGSVLLSSIVILLILSFGNPQSHKYVYMWQAYVLDRRLEVQQAFPLGVSLKTNAQIIIKYKIQYMKIGTDIYVTDYGPLEIPANYTGTWKAWTQQGDLLVSCDMQKAWPKGIQVIYKSGDVQLITDSHMLNKNHIDNTVIFDKKNNIDKRQQYKHLLKDHSELLDKKYDHEETLEK